MAAPSDSAERFYGYRRLGGTAPLHTLELLLSGRLTHTLVSLWVVLRRLLTSVPPFQDVIRFIRFFFFFLIMRSTGGEKQQRRTNCTARSAGLETLNWFVGWLAGFSILTSSNLNSAGGQITAYIKYTKILLLKWK